MEEINQQDWIGKWAVYSPNKIAVKEHETRRSFTYAQLNNAGGNLASYLTTELNLSKGDRVAVLAEHCLEYVSLFSAAQKSGIVIVPLNYRLSSVELEYIIKDADPSVIFYENQFAELIPEKSEGFTLAIEKLTENWNKNEVSHFENLPLFDDDCIFLLYTSGTTGFPKGVKYTHKMLFWNSINTSISLIINTETNTVNVMPPFHTGGWNVLVNPVLHHGGYVCLCRKFDAKTVNNLILSEKVSVFMGVPTMLHMMSHEKNFGIQNFESLKYIIVGGEAMPIPLIETYANIDVAIRQGYGMTEVGPNLTSLHQDDAISYKGSIGRSNFYIHTKIMTENNEEAEPNEPGELWIKAPVVTPGYWKNDEETEKAFDKTGKWFKTGDVVIKNEENYLYVVDRIKNMFISGGENIYPSEIEKVILLLEDVEMCVVVAVPDKKWGEVGKAYIQLNQDAAAVTEEDIMEFCKSRLAKFKWPKYIEFIKEFPKNDAGKIDRKKLSTNINSLIK
ncbi:AMP-binding protein [Xanthomarina sp. F1114]|uniref:AMP-binding protein n=1 Tax=Xanthomarina sp. F1114 TaxID=2996019 RepID=UPI00225E1680|nr:AMP-binding protein [Xanthomarina sp. F1114]MCX7548930.1 AMP-binding protein [Xanthomarina sp. F1114]